jgi:site-specific DNA-methyltransferase (adenine-specific)
MPSEIKLYNMDCMVAMKEMKDKAFDLAIVDPPYGIERMSRIDNDKNHRISLLKSGLWNTKPSQEYFNQLFRVSREQIIWGSNNFNLPASEYFCVWNKKQTVDNFASAELAFVSMGLKQPAKIYDYSIHKHNQTEKTHPTQKPVDLYSWLLKTYAKEYNKILDTHLGSGSIAIACWDMGFDLTGYEIDKDYYDAAVKRLENHKKQLVLF